MQMWFLTLNRSGSGHRQSSRMTHSFSPLTFRAGTNCCHPPHNNATLLPASYRGESWLAVVIRATGIRTRATTRAAQVPGRRVFTRPAGWASAHSPPPTPPPGMACPPPPQPKKADLPSSLSSPHGGSPRGRKLNGCRKVSGKAKMKL